MFGEHEHVGQKKYDGVPQVDEKINTFQSFHKQDEPVLFA